MELKDFYSKELIITTLSLNHNEAFDKFDRDSQRAIIQKYFGCFVMDDEPEDKEEVKWQKPTGKKW